MGYWGCSGPVSAVSLLLLSHSSAGSETEVHFVRTPLCCFKKKKRDAASRSVWTLPLRVATAGKGEAEGAPRARGAGLRISVASFSALFLQKQKGYCTAHARG